MKTRNEILKEIETLKQEMPRVQSQRSLTICTAKIQALEWAISGRTLPNPKTAHVFTEKEWGMVCDAINYYETMIEDEVDDKISGAVGRLGALRRARTKVYETLKPQSLRKG